MEAIERERLRLVFDDVAELYDRCRPNYPAELLTDLEELAGIGPGSRILEIGCGSGQLTLPMAERGHAILALDIGPGLAALAARKLTSFPAVRVMVTAFEDWTPPSEPFDAVVSATAFHWLDPTTRVSKAADSLRPGGTLATIATHHIAGGDAEFFAEAQACYARCAPAILSDLGLPAATDIPHDSEEVDRSERFGVATFRRYEWEQTYSTASYCELLLTYSTTRSLPPVSRQALLDCIVGLIESRYNGQITKRYLTEMRLAHRRPACGETGAG